MDTGANRVIFNNKTLLTNFIATESKVKGVGTFRLDLLPTNSTTLYTYTKNNKPYRGIKLNPPIAAPYRPVLYYPVPYHTVHFVSRRVFYHRVLSHLIVSCTV